MTMKNPAHPGAIIKDCLDDLGLTVAEGAKALGVSRSQLTRVVSKKSAVSPEMAMRLELVLGSKAEMWLRLQNAFDLALVRTKATGFGLKKIVAEHPHL